MVESRKAVRITKIARQKATRERNRPRKRKERVRKLAAAKAKAERMAKK